MEEKNQEKKGLCAISKEFANTKLQELVNNPEKKAILDEYFTWVNVLNSTVNVVDGEEPVKEEEVVNKPTPKKRTKKA